MQWWLDCSLFTWDNQQTWKSTIDHLIINEKNMKTIALLSCMNLVPIAFESPIQQLHYAKEHQLSMWFFEFFVHCTFSYDCSCASVGWWKANNHILLFHSFENVNVCNILYYTIVRVRKIQISGKMDSSKDISEFQLIFSFDRIVGIFILTIGIHVCPNSKTLSNDKWQIK